MSYRYVNAPHFHFIRGRNKHLCIHKHTQTTILCIFSLFLSGVTTELVPGRIDIVAQVRESIGMGNAWQFESTPLHSCIQAFAGKSVDYTLDSIEHAQNITVDLPIASEIPGAPSIDESQQLRLSSFQEYGNVSGETMPLSVMDDESTQVDGVEVELWIRSNTSASVVDKRVFWEFGTFPSSLYDDTENKAKVGAWEPDTYERRVYGGIADRWKVSSEQWRRAFSTAEQPMPAFLLDVQYSTNEYRRAEIACFVAHIYVRADY